MSYSTGPAILFSSKGAEDPWAVSEGMERRPSSVGANACASSGSTTACNSLGAALARGAELERPVAQSSLPSSRRALVRTRGCSSQPAMATALSVQSGHHLQRMLGPAPRLHVRSATRRRAWRGWQHEPKEAALPSWGSREILSAPPCAGGSSTIAGQRAPPPLTDLLTLQSFRSRVRLSDEC